MSIRSLFFMSASVLALGCGGSFMADLADAGPPPDDAGPDRILGDHSDSGADAEVPPDAADSPADVVDAGHEADAPACTCVNDLSNAGLSDLAIAFTVTTTMQPTPPGYGEILNQRKTCDARNPGWDTWLNPNGTISWELYDGSNVFDNLQSTKMVNDGTAHRVVLDRYAGGTKFRIAIDGHTESFDNPAEDLSGMFVALQQGLEPICSANGAQPSEPFVGSITNVCIACVPS